MAFTSLILYNDIVIMEIKTAKTQDEFFGLIQLRKDVFVNEQSVDVNLEMDTYDLSALHFIAVEKEEVIATCRLILKEGYGKLGRMAVKKEHRSLHIGSKLLAYAEKQVLANNIFIIKLEAQTHAIDFYLANGYKITSSIFFDANIPHRMMEKQLK